MSIAIIRGAETSRLTEIGSHEIPKEVFSLLTGRASTAGKQIELRTFKSEEDLIDCLRRANEACFEFVMLDPGTCECSSQQLRNIMNRLTMPYIEVHDDHVIISADPNDPASRMRGTRESRPVVDESEIA